ncbi:ATP-binding protein [Streptomyces kunmingensis]|uniref:ATP-binding protein n=1 Tax=Streptomyces kunmingensis TaxID=68225 RepID=A0ABU6CNM6_9ACTN|nr:ATP-binding protein [Streptomyces kunmingensis]MEB3965826.1 ATP-binding protein [Streptomyces kunmingensis]
MSTVSPLGASPGPVPGTYTFQLPHDPRAPGIARAALRSVLVAYGRAELADDVELLASELLTNAHRHTTGPYALRIGPGAVDAHRVRVAVWDGEPKIPPGFGTCVPSADLTAEEGRGLFLVRAYADDWGAYALPETSGGKLLWAECGVR